MHTISMFVEQSGLRKEANTLVNVEVNNCCFGTGDLGDLVRLMASWVQFSTWIFQTKNLVVSGRRLRHDHRQGFQPKSNIYLSLYISILLKACGLNGKSKENPKELKIFCMSDWNNIPLQMSPTLLEIMGRHSEHYYSPQGRHHNILILSVPIIMKPVLCNK